MPTSCPHPRARRQVSFQQDRPSSRHGREMEMGGLPSRPSLASRLACLPRRTRCVSRSRSFNLWDALPLSVFADAEVDGRTPLCAARIVLCFLHYPSQTVDVEQRSDAAASRCDARNSQHCTRQHAPRLAEDVPPGALAQLLQGEPGATMVDVAATAADALSAACRATVCCNTLVS